jgi:hypothetical protein
MVPPLSLLIANPIQKSNKHEQKKHWFIYLFTVSCSKSLRRINQTTTIFLGLRYSPISHPLCHRKTPSVWKFWKRRLMVLKIEAAEKGSPWAEYDNYQGEFHNRNVNVCFMFHPKQDLSLERWVLRFPKGFLASASTGNLFISSEK